MFSIKDKYIILTGSTGYLGYEMAKGLLKNGARLLCTVRPGSKSKRAYDIEKLGGRVYEVDLGQIKEIDKFFNDIKHMRVDGLINNACFLTKGNLERISFESWKKGIEGSLNMPFYCIQKTIPFLKLTSGCILNISSMYGIVSLILPIMKV